MLRMKATSTCLGVLLLLAACGGDDSDGGHDGSGDADADPDQPDGGPLSAQIFDHAHIGAEDIPSGCLDQLKSGDFVFHYAHRSHGSQIIVGADSLEADLADLQFEASYCSVPGGSDILKMWDGMTDNNLVEQDQYWASDGGLDELRGILGDNPELKYSMWAWSFEINEQTESSVQDYLDAMDMLESEFPGVRFIYMTGPAASDPFMAVNNAERNAQIRAYAEANGKLLFDFEELDTFSGGENHTEVIDGETIPYEHPDFDLDTDGNSEYEFTHTTQASCEQKARAFWGMLAALECGG